MIQSNERLERKNHYREIESTKEKIRAISQMPYVPFLLAVVCMGAIFWAMCYYSYLGGYIDGWKRALRENEKPGAVVAAADGN